MSDILAFAKFYISSNNDFWIRRSMSRGSFVMYITNIFAHSMSVVGDWGYCFNDLLTSSLMFKMS